MLLQRVHVDVVMFCFTFRCAWTLGKKMTEDRTRKGRTEKLDRDLCGVSRWTPIEKEQFTDVYNGGFKNLPLL